MRKTLWIIVILLIIAVAILGGWKSGHPSKIISSYDDCVAAGNPVMESYPAQCNTPDGKHFVQDIGNENEKLDKIKITTPRPGQVITSPLTITGQARGTWFFEATFPVVLTDWDGKILAQGIAEAQGDWMTEEFVPFKSVLNYPKVPDSTNKKGTLILKKDNPSGDPKNDDSLEIPVVIN